MAEWSKALDLGSSPFEGVGSNPTRIIMIRSSFGDVYGQEMSRAIERATSTDFMCNLNTQRTFRGVNESFPGPAPLSFPMRESRESKTMNNNNNNTVHDMLKDVRRVLIVM